MNVFLVPKPSYSLFSTLFAVFLGSLLSAGVATAQNRGGDFPRLSPNATVTQTVGLSDIKVTYGRPSVKARKVFGELEPFDKIWRTGANEATTITFPHEVKIEGKALAAGTYGLFTIPGPEKWTIVFNSKPNQWGAFAYKDSLDVLRVAVKPNPAPHQEQFAIAFENVTNHQATLILRWAGVAVPVAIAVNTDSIFRANAEAKLAEAKSSQTHFQYAFATLMNEMMMEDGLGWITRGLAMEENYNNLAVKARLLAKLGRNKEAIAFAERALKADQKGKFEPPILTPLPELIEVWKNGR